MANLNKVFLMGNLTRDPELSYTPAGAAICKFGMAINRIWKAKDGEKQEEVTFVDLEAWARTAEVIAEHCRKGSAILVEGRLHFSQWEGKDGQKRSKLTVTVEGFQFVGAKGAANSDDESGETPF